MPTDSLGSTCPEAAQPGLQEGGRQAADALRTVFLQVAQVVDSLTGSQYTCNSVPAFCSSVGQQVRHGLDHVDAVLIGIDTGLIDYENRRRCTAVETDRSVALQEIRRLDHCLATMPEKIFRRSVVIASMLTCPGPAVQLQSTIERELAFVFSHLLHHLAIICAMIKTLGGAVPDDLGYAPGTMAYMQEMKCAP